MLQLVYHESLGLRLAPIEMILLHLGVEYSNVGPQWAPNRVLGESTDGPCFAPPALHDGDFAVSQFPAIMQYVAGQHGMVPSDRKKAATALQLLLDICDISSEIFKEGKEKESKAKFLDGGRLASWMAHLEKAVAKHGTGKGLMGEDLIAADLVVLFQSLDFVFGAEASAAATPAGLSACRQFLMAQPFVGAHAATNPAPVLFESHKHA